MLLTDFDVTFNKLAEPPDRPWFVFCTRDGSTVQTGFNSKQQALGWIQGHVARHTRPKKEH